MTDVTATPSGVEEKPLVIGNAERNSRLAELAAAARKERDDEISANGGEVIDTMNVESVGEEAPAEQTEPEAKAEEAPKPEPEAAKPEPKDEYITVKVDGIERQVPKSAVIDAGIRAVQKESAADKRLEEATRLLREAQETTKPKTPQPSDMDAAEISARIRMGSEEEAVQAVQALGRQQATPEQIEAAVTNRVLGQIEFKDAATWFQSEYKEIVSDPYLLQMATAREDFMRSQGDGRSYREIYKEIGDGIRAKLTEWKGGKAEVTTSTEKKERKAEIINLPSASVRQAAPEQPKPKTPSQVIDDMRKRRGQAA